MKRYVLLVFLVIPFILIAQQKPEFDKMKFLIGEWEFDAKSRQEDGSFQAQKFRSKVEYLFGGNAHKDDFQIQNPQGNWVVYGSTIRSYDTQSGKWRMLWYNYNLSFVTKMVGEFRDGEFHFLGEGEDAKGKYLERITFYGIKENQYSWKNDKSYDDGQTWQENFFSYTARRLN